MQRGSVPPMVESGDPDGGLLMSREHLGMTFDSAPALVHPRTRDGQLGDRDKGDGIMPGCSEPDATRRAASPEQPQQQPG